MPTTTAGTVYTVYTDNVGGQTVVWAVADSNADSAALPTILYCHGAAGAADQFATLGAWKGFREWLIDNGWAWVECDGGGSQPWGNPASQAAYDVAFSYVDSILQIGSVVVLGRSMGGAVGARLYLAHRAGDTRFIGFINNSGVQDLVWAYDYNSGAWTGAFKTAWRVSSKAEFVTAVAGLNPIDGPASAWDGTKVLQLWGDADTTVVPANNAIAMRTMYTGHPNLNEYDIRAGGDHSSSNGTYLEVEAMTAFLTEITGGGPAPAPPPPLKMRATFMDIGGERHLVYPRY